MLERKEHLVMFKKNDNGTAIAVSLLQLKNGHSDFSIYLIGFQNRNNKKIGKCCTVISVNNSTEELTMKIYDTKILDEYQGNHYGEMLVDEVFKYAKAIGVKKITGERSGF